MLGTGMVGNVRRESRPATPPAGWTATMAVLFAADVLLWSDRTNFSVAVAAWGRQLHWSPTVAGALLSAFSLGYLLLQPLGGHLSDRLGTRRMVAASCAAWSLFTLLTPLVASALWLLGACRALLGIGEAPFFPATATAIARAVPEQARRARYSGLINAGASLGPALGSAGAALVAGSLGVDWIFILFGGVGLLLAAGWWLYARGRAEPASATGAGTAEAAARAAQTALPLGSLLSQRTVRALCASYFSVPYCLFLFAAWLPAYLTRYRHFHLVAAGLLSALPFLAAFIGAVAAGLASDALARSGWTWGGLHRKLPVYVGAATYVAAILAAALTPSAAWAVAMLVVANLGLSFITGQYWTIVTDITAAQAGTLSGWMNLSGGIGATLAPVVSGWLAAASGAFVLPFVVGAGVMAAGAVVLGLLVRVEPLGRPLAAGEAG
jgi:ACS family glucarate transporter-like MFS transporter